MYSPTLLYLWSDSNRIFPVNKKLSKKEFFSPIGKQESRFAIKDDLYCSRCYHFFAVNQLFCLQVVLTQSVLCRVVSVTDEGSI